ncbi:MAG: hypothetical protein ABFD79_04885 [Phycisphaerales bacterium]
MDKKEADMRKLIEALRKSPEKAIFEVVILSYAQGLEAGANLAVKKDPAA